MIKNKINNQYAKKVLTFLAIVFYLIGFSQPNLIPNPSFESAANTPSLLGNYFCNNWYVSFGTPDFYTPISPLTLLSYGYCGVSIPYNSAGFQNPKTGNNYMGFILRSGPKPSQGNPNYVINFEMFGNQLSQPLIKNHVYDFSLYYNLANMSDILSTQFSVLFSVNKPNFGSFTPTQTWYDNNLNNLKPQVENDTTNYINADTLNWTSLNGCFIAEGGEQYLTIGNFKDNKFNRTKIISTNYTLGCNTTPPVWDYICYLYIDDVSLYDRGYYSGKVKAKNDTTICFNTPYVIGNNAKDSSTYVWQPATGLSCTNCPNPIANPSVTTKYVVTKTLCSYITKDTITITVYSPTATAKAGNDYTICANQNKVLQLGTADSTNFAFYKWLPSINLSCTNCATPICVPTNDITYLLQRTECNVTSTSSVTITLEDCETIYTIPNIFTPNNDDVNDTWGINFNQVRYVKGFYVRVYNRWGTLLFESDKPNRKWDAHTTSGEPVSDGIYFYTLEFTVNDKPINLKGSITLLR